MKITPVWLEKCEQLIRSGQIQNAGRLMMQIDPTQVKRPLRAPLATLARRSGKLAIGFRLLNQAVNNPTKRGPANAHELAEYAILLTLSGALNEAFRIFERVPLDQRENPAVLLAKAWCYFERWDYPSAIPLLKTYIQKEDDSYKRTAGKVNLAEAYLATGHEARALKLLDASVSYAARHRQRRLHANALTLRARLYLEKNQIKRAEIDLETAHELFGRTETSDALLVRRQIAIHHALTSRTPKMIRAFQNEAQRAGDWESVRECDLQRLSLKFNPQLFEKLFYGTPYPKYRERLKKQMTATNDSRDFFLWGSRSGPVLDLQTGKIERPKFSQAHDTLCFTPQIQFILDSILRDLYRPIEIAGLFAALFPQEPFDFESSPDRVHQALKRLRQWLKINHLPLLLRCDQGKYTLQRTAPFAIRIAKATRLTETRLQFLDEIQMRFGRKSFTAKEVREQMSLSKATATRKLTSACQSGKLTTSGLGKNTLYRTV